MVAGEGNFRNFRTTGNPAAELQTLETVAGPVHRIWQTAMNRRAEKAGGPVRRSLGLNSARLDQRVPVSRRLGVA